MAVEVRIDPAALAKLPAEVHKGLHVLNALRDGGIPATGVIFTQGVTHGALVQYVDDMFGDHVYRWHETTDEVTQ